LIKRLLSDHLIPSPEFQQVLRSHLDGEPNIRLGGVIGSLPAFVLSALAKEEDRPLLAITSDESTGDDLYNDLEAILGPGRVALFPTPDLVPYEEKFASPEVIGRRMDVILRLAAREPLVVVAPVRALLYPTMARADWPAPSPS